MRLSSPDLTSPFRLLATAGCLGLAVCAVLAWKLPLTGRLGDTDDAMRLVMVRDLLAGRGWYDQAIQRLAPPGGVYMHWSRLLDGALAGVDWLFSRVVPLRAAEDLTRLVWPLAWVFPALACALAIARDLGGRSAVFLTIPALLLTPQLYRQFIPGRIDHHSVQIVMTLAAAACLLAPRRRSRWAAMAGGATALGLAIGLEALPFHALIGAGYGLALARDRRQGRPATAYGLALAGGAATLFFLQTPPERWSAPFCDALGANLVVGLVVAGLGLALTGSVAARASGPVRMGLLAATAALAVVAYLYPDGRCLAGPFAGVEPAARSLWLDKIQEMQALPSVYARDRPGALAEIAAMVLGLGAAAYLLASQGRPPRTGMLVIAACVAVAAAAACLAYRMEFYVFWIGLPTLAAALSTFAERRMRDLMIPSLSAAVVLTPVMLGAAATTGFDIADPRPPRPVMATGEPCFEPAAYQSLAALPTGLVLAGEDYGPFILAYTHHAALVGPYHRLSRAIVAVHAVLDAPPAAAEAMIRRLGVDYVMLCGRRPVATGLAGLGAIRERDRPPSWLQRVSANGAALTVYRVRPANP